MNLNEIRISASCDEGGKKKAKCDGRCIENGVTCVHLILEIKDKEANP